MWWAALLNSFAAVLDSGGAGGAAGDYESIATATGTGASGTITFSSIPSTYKHLQIRILGRSTVASTGASFRFYANNDTTNNYSLHRLSGSGVNAAAAGTASTTMELGRITGASAASGLMGVTIIDVQDYESTTRNKTFRSFSGRDINGGGEVWLLSGLWMSTSAINEINLATSSGNWSTDTTISLYGIKGA